MSNSQRNCSLRACEGGLKTSHRSDDEETVQRSECPYLDATEDAMNWTTLKKAAVTLELCFITTATYTGGAIITAGQEDLIASFHITDVVGTLALSVYLIGSGIGAMIWAGLSEVSSIGRVPTLATSILIFVILQIPTALSTHIAMLLVFRLLGGFFGAAVLAVAGACVSDMYRREERAYAMCLWDISVVLGPTLGPLLGGFAAQAKGWTWTIWTLSWASAIALIIALTGLPETSADKLSRGQQKRLLNVNKVNASKWNLLLNLGRECSKPLSASNIWKPFSLTLTEPVVLTIHIYASLINLLQYLWLESFPIVFRDLYHFSTDQRGLAFLGLSIGSIAPIPPLFWWFSKFQRDKFDANGHIIPEERLPPSKVGCFLVPLSLFWFGWASKASVHWIIPIIGSSLFGVAQTLLYVCNKAGNYHLGMSILTYNNEASIFNYLPDAYPEHVASVIAGNALIRSILGAAVVLLGQRMYFTLGIAWASSLLGFLGCLFIPIPFVLAKQGHKLRERSPRAN